MTDTERATLQEKQNPVEKPLPPTVHTEAHASALEFLLKFVRDKQPDHAWADQAQNFLGTIYGERIAAVTEHYRSKFPGTGEEKDGAVYVTSLPRPVQSYKGGDVTKVTHAMAATHVVEGTHRLATAGEIEDTKTEQRRKVKSIADELARSHEAVPDKPTSDVFVATVSMPTKVLRLGVPEAAEKLASGAYRHATQTEIDDNLDLGPGGFPGRPNPPSVPLPSPLSAKVSTPPAFVPK